MSPVCQVDRTRRGAAWNAYRAGRGVVLAAAASIRHHRRVTRIRRRARVVRAMAVAVTAAACATGCGGSDTGWPDDVEEFSPADVEEYLSGLGGVTSVEAREVVVDDEVRWYVRRCISADATDEDREAIEDALAEAEKLMVEHADSTGSLSEYWSLVEKECDEAIPQG